MDIISHRYWFLNFSGTLVLISWVFVGVFGLKQGIDLKGGINWEIAFVNSTTQAVSLPALRDAMFSVHPHIQPLVKDLDNQIFSIRLPDISESDHELFRTAFSRLGVFEERQFSSIGPTIGAELRTKAISALVLVLIAISLYVAWAFRKVSEPVSSWKYGCITLITLLHDVSIPLGMLALLGFFYSVEIDTNFIVALLVVMGFSVHDTIVVFDRIRENLLRGRSGFLDLKTVINKSIQETMVRSINTSLTLFIVLAALLVVGPASLFYFVLTMLVGAIFGTYSSIFVASPLLYMWQGKGLGHSVV